MYLHIFRTHFTIRALYLDLDGEEAYGIKNDYKDGGFQPWEGEDSNLNGEIDGDSDYDGFFGTGETWIETSPFLRDSERDGVGDGDESLFVLDMGGDDNRVPSEGILTVLTGDAVEDYDEFTCAGLDGYDDDFCERWLLYFNGDGESNEGVSREIESYTDSTNTIVLTEGTPYAIDPGDDFYIIGYTIWNGYMLTDYDVDDNDKISSLEKDSDGDGLDDGVENRDKNGVIGAYSDLEDVAALSYDIECWSVEDWYDGDEDYFPRIAVMDLPTRDDEDPKSVVVRQTKDGNDHIMEFSHTGSITSGTSDNAGNAITLIDTDGELPECSVNYMGLILHVNIAGEWERQTITSYDQTQKKITVENPFTQPTALKDYNITTEITGSVESASGTTLTDSNLPDQADLCSDGKIVVLTGGNYIERTIKSYTVQGHYIEIDGAWSIQNGDPYWIYPEYDFDHNLEVTDGHLYITTDGMSGAGNLEFRFGTDSKVLVDDEGSKMSRLSVYGSENNLVTFTAEETQWKGIHFSADSAYNNLSHCEILLAKSGDVPYYSIYCEGSTTINECVVDGDGLGNDDVRGIYVTSRGTKIECSEIKNYDMDTGYGIYLDHDDDESDADTVIAGNMFASNDISVYAETDNSEEVDYTIVQNYFEGRDDEGDKGISYSQNPGTHPGDPGNGDGTVDYNYFVDYDQEGDKTTNCVNDAVGDNNDYLEIVPRCTKDNPYYYHAYETNPFDTDSDDDGIIDNIDFHWYVPQQSDILMWFADNDGDGLINAMDFDSDDDCYLVGYHGGVGGDVPLKYDGYEDDENNNGQKDPQETETWNGHYNPPHDGKTETNPLSGDTDKDGLEDSIEVLYGLLPLNPDTDGDGIKDGYEPLWYMDLDGDDKICALDPDSDGDGIPDEFEDKNENGRFEDKETNPVCTDTDGDGLWDGWHDDNNNGDLDEGETKGEDVNGNGYIAGDTNWNRIWDEQDDPWSETDPCDVDTDDDGIPDGWIDFDNDGEYDIGEFEDKNCDGNHDDTGSYGAGPIASYPRETRPLWWDTDQDGLPDGLEIGLNEKDVTNDTNVANEHFWPDADCGITITDPTDSDTDDDGLPDGWRDENKDGIKEMNEGEDLDLDGSVAGDTNQNGIWDDDEKWTETNPSAQDLDEDNFPDGIDTDGDHLADGLELGLTRTKAKLGDTGAFPSIPNPYVQYDADSATQTDPLSVDTDGDGLPDGWIDGWGYDPVTNEWGIINPDPEGKKNICEGEDFDFNGERNDNSFETEEKSEGYRMDSETGETCPDLMTDLNGDGAPDGPDTDCDGLQDGLEQLGWYVEVYWERNPNLRFTSYHVWSDPLSDDGDEDGLGDMNESLFGGDPQDTDTDNDGIIDGDECESGSMVDGIEATAPAFEDGLDIDKWYNKKTKYTSWGCPYFAVNVVVKVAGTIIDAGGVSYVYIRVDGAGNCHKDKLLRPDATEDAKRYKFSHKFEFGLSLSSILSDFWSGWDIYVNASDINQNYGDMKEHLNSLKEAAVKLVNKIVDFVTDLINMIIEWLKEKAKWLMNKIVMPLKNGLNSLMLSLAEPLIRSMFNLGDNEGESRQQESNSEFIISFLLLFGLVTFLYVGKTATWAILMGISFGSSSIVMTIINLVSPIIILAIFASIVTEEDPFSALYNIAVGGITGLIDTVSQFIDPIVDFIIDLFGGEFSVFDGWDLGDAIFACVSALFLYWGATGTATIAPWDVLGLTLDIIGFSLAFCTKSIFMDMDIVIGLGDNAEEWLDFICDCANLLIQIIAFVLVISGDKRSYSGPETETSVRIVSGGSMAFSVLQVFISGNKLRK